MRQAGQVKSVTSSRKALEIFHPWATGLNQALLIAACHLRRRKAMPLARLQDHITDLLRLDRASLVHPR